MTRLNELQAAADWRGIAALETEALGLARDVRGVDPGLAGAIHSMLGNAHNSMGDFPNEELSASTYGVPLTLNAKP